MSELDGLAARIIQAGQDEYTWSGGFDTLYDLAIKAVAIAERSEQASAKQEDLFIEMSGLADKFKRERNQARADNALMAHHNAELIREVAQARAVVLALRDIIKRQVYWRDEPDKPLLDDTESYEQYRD